MIIQFNVVVASGISSALNVATIDSDRNGDGDTIDPLEQTTAVATSQWNVGTGGARRLPRTGFAPGRLTLLPDRPDGAYQGYADLGLEIPTLGVNIPIVGVPVTDNGWDVTWLGSQAGYLQGTAFPTWSGNSVLTGHVYLPNGLPGPFVKLGALKYGDRIVVNAFGSRYIYEVRSVAAVGPDDLSPLRHEDRPWLTLITCRQYDEGSDSYRYRTVVRAVLIEVK
jgi:LPXTG-site transpeptidase (sortase) family protein